MSAGQSTAVASSRTRSCGAASRVTPSTLVTQPPSEFAKRSGSLAQCLNSSSTSVGVDVEPHDVGEGHVGGGQDGLEVVERELELRGHVARMMRVTVGVHRVLSAADELSLVPLDELGLVEPQLA